MFKRSVDDQREEPQQHPQNNKSFQPLPPSQSFHSQLFVSSSYSLLLSSSSTKKLQQPWTVPLIQDDRIVYLTYSPLIKQRQQHHHHQQQQQKQQKQLKEKTVQSSKTSPPSSSSSDVVSEEQQEEARNRIGKLDIVLFCTYLCNAISWTVPILAMPYIAAEMNIPLPPFVATVASIATLGGGIGKLMNGFICQQMGGRNSSSLYLMGISFCSLGLISSVNLSSTTMVMNASTTTMMIGCIIAAIEFFASIQWTAMSLLLANHYQPYSPMKFSRGVSIVSLSSTIGSLFAKLGGSVLLQQVHGNWRMLTRSAAMVACLGAILVRFLASEYPVSPAPLLDHRQQKLPNKNNNINKNNSTINNDNNNYEHKPYNTHEEKDNVAAVTRKQMLDDNSNNNKSTRSNNQGSKTTANNNNNATTIQVLRQVLGNPIFWQVGIAHATAFLARSSDRVLGAFFQEVTSLPRHICGGLTASITLGFVHGLVMKGNQFQKLKDDIPSKVRMLSRGYIYAVLSALGLALCANPYVRTTILHLFFEGGATLFASSTTTTAATTTTRESLEFISSSSSLVSSATASLSSPSSSLYSQVHCYLLAGIVSLLSANLASSLSFQFYQIPALVSNTIFTKRCTSVGLSFFDGLGFLLSAPIWAWISSIVSRFGPNYGWSIAFLVLGTLFGIGGRVMTQALPSILLLQQQQVEKIQQNKSNNNKRNSKNKQKKQDQR